MKEWVLMQWGEIIQSGKPVRVKIPFVGFDGLMSKGQANRLKRIMQKQKPEIEFTIHRTEQTLIPCSFQRSP